MCDTNSANCLTRIVMDNTDIDVANVQVVMNTLQRALCGIPLAQREYIANALLNMAVSRMVCEDGSARTAGILARLGDAVATQNGAPSPERPFNLSVTHS